MRLFVRLEYEQKTCAIMYKLFCFIPIAPPQSGSNEPNDYDVIDSGE
jgi:hypothetical protein